MELMLVILGLAVFAAVAGRYGVDTRPRIGDEPRRAI